MKPWHLLLILATIAIPLAAQPAAKPPESKTKIEAFQAKTGTVIVTGFTTMGEVKGEFGKGDVTVEAIEFIEANSGTKVFGIRIDVSQGDEIDTQSISFVDADEIDSLLKGIDYIAKVDKSATKMNDFQADYKTRGDLTISTFSEANGSIGVAVKSGDIGLSRVFLNSDGLTSLRALIVQAEAQIGSSR
ncbi:MAG: hypothetical protein ACLPLZ_08730 [Terracidiphilus sp.]